MYLRAVDATGQTLRHEPHHPLEARDPRAWYLHTVDLDAPAASANGANDGRVRDGVLSLAVLATEPLEAGASGLVEFDDVTLTDTVTAALEPSAPLAASAPLGSEALSRVLGVEVHFTRDDRALGAARTPGFGVVRLDLARDWIETRAGVYDVAQFNALLFSLEARGMRAHFILDDGNPLHAEGRDALGQAFAPPSPATIAAYSDYVEAAARHFVGRPVEYEVWNEPNIPQFWITALDPVQYAALAREAIARVHRGDPSAVVSTAGISGFDLTFLRGYIAAGGAAGAGAIGVHPYRQTGPETAAEELLYPRSIVASTVRGAPPGWDTEGGYSSTALAVGASGGGRDAAARGRQAVLTVREALAHWVLGLPRTVLYDLRDDGTDPNDREQHFGLLANDYTDKPAMRALRTFGAAASGRTSAGTLATPTSTRHALRLDGASATVLVRWVGTLDTSSAVTVPAPATAVE